MATSEPDDAALSRWLIDSATDFAMIATDLGGRVTAWSAGAVSILGWTREEMLGQTVERIFTPEDRAAGRAVTEMRCALEQGAGTDERWHLRKDGGRFWASGEMTPLRTDAGETIGFVKVLRDRTEQHDAVSRLREQEEQTRLLLNSTAEAIYAVDSEGRATLCNQSFLKMMGFGGVEETLGRKLHDLIHHSHLDGSPFPAVECPLYQAARDGVPVHNSDDIFFRRDGSAMPVEYWGTPILKDGHPQGLICAFLDISERKHADESRRAAALALHELNATLEARVAERTRERDRLWEVSEDLLVVGDYEGRLLRVSPSWTRTLGWSEAQLLAHAYPSLIHPDDFEGVGAILRDMREANEPVRYENRVRTIRGAWRTIAWSLAPEPGGQRFSGSGRDMTMERTRQAELDAAQDALRQSQKLEAVGQLTGGVAHDFNNLLTIISSSVDFLQRPELPEARKQRYLGAISETVERASKLTSQLLAFARRQPLKPEVFDISERVRGTVALVRSLVGARITIQVHAAPEGECLAYADAGQFETALVNLLVNARDAMDGEGEVTLRVFTSDSVPAVRSHARRPGAFVAISVTDTGKGVPPSQLDSIFEPFFTTKEVGKGTGLGLSQVFGFIKQSHGEVEVVSPPGEGATFTIYLPRSEDLSAVKPGKMISHARIMGAGACVLVVEDNEAVGQFSTEMLRDLGYETTWCGGGAEALTLLLDPDKTFQLVFTDVIMPGMNGIDFAKQVRRQLPDMPVLLTSGYSDVLAAQGTHGFELVSKPYSVETLSRAVAAALRASKVGVDP